jgi:hypothetical protein
VIRALVAVVAAMLALAPAALADNTFTVNDPGDAPDFDQTDMQCDSDAGAAGNQCTLRAAIQQANFTTTQADTINFTGAGRNPQPQLGFSGSDSASPTCCAVLGPTTIDGGGLTTISFAASAAGPLLSVAANDSVLRGLTITGGASGDAVRLYGVRDRLDTVTIHGVKGNAVVVFGADARLDAVHVASPGADGIVVSGARTTISGADVGGAPGTGIAINADGAHVSGGRVHSNHGDGVHIAGQSDVVTQTRLFGNGGKPIGLSSGANGGIAPPQNLRIGPRRADGSLPLTGSNPSGGNYEIFRGNPFSSSEPSYLTSFSSGPGDFTYNFGSEPHPGDTFALTVTGGGTSEFATVTTPNDIASPDVLRARALSTTEVRLDTTEPLDPGSVAPEDFALSMAGQDRQVTAATASPDGSFITLTSSGWKEGEAGYVNLTSAGAVADPSGNASLMTTRMRVAAAPGDFLAPIAGQLAFKPSSICLTHGRGCRVTGTVIRFVTTEQGKATLVIQRGNKRVGKRLYAAVDAGLNSLKFNGRLGGRKLRAGRYRALLYVQDQVGNVTDQPPIALLTVRRTTK